MPYIAQTPEARNGPIMGFSTGWGVSVVAYGKGKLGWRFNNGAPEMAGSMGYGIMEVNGVKINGGNTARIYWYSWILDIRCPVNILGNDSVIQTWVITPASSYWTN